MSGAQRNSPLRECSCSNAIRLRLAEAIADHKRNGDPIVVWQDGKVVKVAPDQTEIREPAAEYKNPSKKDN